MIRLCRQEPTDSTPHTWLKYLGLSGLAGWRSRRKVIQIVDCFCSNGRPPRTRTHWRGFFIHRWWINLPGPSLSYLCWSRKWFVARAVDRTLILSRFNVDAALDWISFFRNCSTLCWMSGYYWDQACGTTRIGIGGWRWGAGYYWL